MKPSHQILTSELERLFSVGSLRELCTSYLGIEPEQVGVSDETKAVFARRLVEHSAKSHATEALVDTLLMLKRVMVDPRLKHVGEERFEVSDIEAGTSLLGFTVESKVGDGSLGSVYRAVRAEAPNDAERFALKIIRPEHSLDPHAVNRFMVYMRFLSKIEHSALPKIEAIGKLEDGRPYVVSRWIEGETLDKKGARGVREAISIVQDVVEALAPIHERGFVHGDLNVRNILEKAQSSGECRVALLGFGVDRLLLRAEPDVDFHGRAFGSFYGIAPEQARGKQPDARTDLYALGALLYELATGQPVFAGRTPLDVIAAHLRDEPRPVARATGDRAASALEEILSRLLTKEPSHRPHDLSEVRGLLEAAARKAESLEAQAGQVGSLADIEIAAETLLADPADPEALELLRSEAGRLNAWPAAVETMEEAAVSCSNEEATRALLLAATQAIITHVKDYDKAQALLSQVLVLRPQDPVALATQLSLLRASGRYEELIQALAQKAQETEAPGAKLAFIEEISVLYDTCLSDYANALDYAMACLQPSSPDEALLSRLDKLADRTNRFADLAAATANAAGLAESAGALDAAAVYYRFTGKIYLERLDQSAYALHCFQKVLAEKPADIPALEAIADLYRGAQQWNEVARVMRFLGEVEKSPERSRNRFVEAAQILCERLSDPAMARAILESVLSEDPAHKNALFLYASLLEKWQDWDQLTKALLLGADAMADGPARAETYLRLAEIEEAQRGNRKAAATAFQAALKIEPRNLGALKGLERLYSIEGDNAAMRDNLELQLELVPTPKQKVSILERLAEIYEEEFKDLPRAIDALRAVLELDGEHRGAMVTLTRLYKKTERFEDLASVLERRANVTDDVAEKRELLTDRASVVKDKLGDAQRAAKTLAQVASLGDESALDSLARTQEEAQDFEAAAETLRKMIDNATTIETKVELSLRLAELEAGPLTNPQQAAVTLQRVRTWVPNDRRAISQLRSVFVVQGNYTAAIDLLDEELTMVEGSAARAKLIAEMGVITMQYIRDEDRAIAYFERALELDENNLAAGDNLSTAYRLRGQWEKAMPIYKRWADAAGVLTNEKRIELFSQMGEAFDHLGQRDEALKAFSRAADVAGVNPHLILRLGEVALEVGELAVAKAELGKFLELAGDSLEVEDRAAVLVKLSRACLGTNDVPAAAKLARQAGAMAPDSIDARVMLAAPWLLTASMRG
ncbi:MAG: protein kinase [Myxococcota bacterium]|nr:protein kinase [Myxococcota bacterium]